jgi:mannosyltransferase
MDGRRTMVTAKERRSLQPAVPAPAAARSLTRRTEFVWLIVALCVGALLIFWRLTDKSLHIDEAFSYGEVVLPLPNMLHSVAYGDFHPPLFYLVFHAIDGWLHLPAYDYRYFTAPFGLLTIVATWALARRWFGVVAAAVAALVVATQPMLVAEDRLFRMYVIITALAMLSWWLLVAAQESSGTRRRWLWLGYGVSAILMPYVLYLGTFIVAAQALYGLVHRRTAWPAIAWAGAAALALAPWYWAIRIQLPSGAFTGFSPDWQPIAAAVLLWTPPQAWNGVALDIGVSAAAIAIIGAACWIARATPLPYLFVPLLLQIAGSLALHKQLMIYRYLTMTLPPFAIAVGALAAWLLQSRARLAGALLVIAVLGLNSVALANFLLDPFYQSTDWYAVELALHERVQPGDAMVFNQAMPYLVMRGFPDVKGRAVYPMSYPFPPQNAIAWIDAQPNARIWYIENQADFSDPRRLVLKHLVATRPQLFSVLQKHSSLANWALLDLFGPERATSK